MKKSCYILSIIALLISACADHKATPGAGQLNAQASLPEGFAFSKMGLKVITSTINKKSGTMSTLYGNDSAKVTAQAGNAKCLPAAVFVLVTWKQQPDKRWIGGNIPGKLVSVETLKGQKQGTDLYERFKGADLKADLDTTGQNERIDYILGLKASIMF